MFYPIHELEGIGPDFILKLKDADITTTEHLLEKATDPKRRSQLAGVTAISEPLLAKWVAMADLMRIKGVKPYTHLLLASGVDSTEKLLTFEPKDLVLKMDEQNKLKRLAPNVPSSTDVELWMNEVRAPVFALAK